MKVAHSPYVLEGEKSRPGAILRWELHDGSIGFSDCNPCVERGDLPIEKQLTMLRHKQFTPLTLRAHHFAEIDAAARRRGVSLFKGLKIPKSNFLITNIESWNLDQLEKVLERGFTRVKVKLSRHFDTLKPLVQHFASRVKWRLDFNNKLTKGSFHQFLDESKPFWEHFDYIEDPFPFDEKDWKEIQKKKITLACDYQSDEAVGKQDAATVLVLKPVVQNENHYHEATPTQKFVVTTYLDHPVGQATAAYVAGKLQAEYPERMGICGLLTDHLYPKSAFSECLATNSPDFKIPFGTGFGFDDLLAQLDWKHD